MFWTADSYGLRVPGRVQASSLDPVIRRSILQGSYRTPERRHYNGSKSARSSKLHPELASVTQHGVLISRQTRQTAESQGARRPPQPPGH